ncbi:hypothetical protein DH2020_041215 [Rehmannia glutinosa]|uniref:Protein FAR1-RELATED SEQUENCE n=1 Tax=Rehmannia glutinosa TaxID=99300 RepID=A0ABR0US81_REHGL
MEVTSSSMLSNSNLEPRDDMEFDTHEAAYEYYKEYAKSVGFGTAKLSSRRSRASKEFIDAKFSCIRYGNKQQSDDAINPRPSPKIGCKASMHVKRKPTGKWYIHSFMKEHNHELLPAQAHFFRSHRNADSVHNDAKFKKKKAIASVLKQYGAYQFSGSSVENVIRNQHDRGRYLSLEEGGAQKFNIQEDEWIQALYEDRRLWVPAFMKDVSYAGLSAASRSESLNSFFDRYIHGETSLRDLIGKYKSVLEDRYEEEAKANFDAWHETPELKSPSPFEKQMLLVYTHEIFQKFQMEVLGAAACHLKKEKEDGSAVLYGVKDFENNQDFMVEWDELKSDIYCSCRSFQYKGYLCRHSIVVLQMSGVFSIPFKYILQRWTNAATSRIPLSEKLDEVQAKVRRYNDLCRRAIILGEEGSLSHDSYITAVGAISEALKQCVNVNKPCENELRPDISTPLAIQGVAGVSHNVTITSEQQWPMCKLTQTAKGSKRTNSGKELASNSGITSKKGKDMPGPNDYPPLYPRFLTTLLKGGEMSKRSVEMLGEMLEEQS